MGARVDVAGVAAGRARRAGRLDCPELDSGRPRCVGRAARVDGQRLRPQLRGAADDGRGARRPLRAPARIRVRSGAVCGGLGRVRAGTGRWLVDRGARRAGSRRGIRDAARARPVGRRFPARAATEGARSLCRRERAGRSSRPAVRGRGCRVDFVAVDLLAQRPDRPARDLARPAPDRGELRARHRDRRSRAGARHEQRLRDRLGPRARERGGGGRVARSCSR
jgi:hypothetical protein